MQINYHKKWQSDGRNIDRNARVEEEILREEGEKEKIKKNEKE